MDELKLNDFSVLALDDQAENLAHIMNCLREMGVDRQVYTAPNGKIGFMLACKYLPDLVITDWEMPEMDGLEFIRQLKEEASTRHIPVIMTTGIRIDAAELTVAFNVGVHDFLRKPFDKLEFQARIKNTLRLAMTEKSLRQTNERLIVLSEAKSRFFADISHDLKTPINLILGQTDLLLSAHSDYLPDSTLGKLEKIKKLGNKLNYLSDEIRELVRLEEGQLQMSLMTFPIVIVLEDVLSVLRPLLQETMRVTLLLEVKLPVETCVSLDAQQFEKVLYNLLSNAAQYSPQGGTIKVTCSTVGKYVTISIIDEGPGISEDKIDRIFDRFYGFSSEKGGLGIGLSIAKEIVQLHSGKISVETSGQGTNFIITLPTVDPVVFDRGFRYTPTDTLKPNLQESFTDIPVSAAPMENQKGTILVIDDNPDVREVIREVLSGNYRVIEANNGANAFEKLGRYKIDLIITDLMMPVLDGFGLLQKIQEDKSYINIPCLIVSSRYEVEARKKALTFGVSNFMPKNFDHDELLLRVEELIRQGGAASFSSVFEKYDIENATRTMIEKLEKYVQLQLSNSLLGVYDLASEVAVSERKMFRFFKDKLEMTPLEFIKKIRFTHVKILLEEKKVASLSEAAKSIGMTNVTNFKSQFQKQFGYAPAIKA